MSARWVNKDVVGAPRIAKYIFAANRPMFKNIFCLSSTEGKFVLFEVFMLNFEKMRVLEVLCLVFVVGLSSAFPRTKSGYFPRSYMVGGSFYANPRYVREGPGYEYIPPGQMTAMVVGDTVATNSFSGAPPGAIFSPPVVDVGQVPEEQVPEQITEKQQPISVQEPDSINETEPEEVAEPEQNVGEQETLFSLEDVTTEAVFVPTTKVVPVAPPRAPPAVRKSKAGKAKRPVTAAPPQPAEEDEEEDSGLSATWPFAGAGRAGIPAYNAFFPIFIGGSSPSARSRTRSAEEGYPGSATAIANSFSTGKGGVATSHATSFGDPAAAAVLRNAGLFNFRTKSLRKQPVTDIDEE